MNEKITLQDIIDLLSEKQNIDRKEAELFTKGMFELIEDVLPNEKLVKIKGLGSFKLTEVDSRESVDVNTGERIEIQGHTKMSFTPDSSMKELINKPFSHFETVVLNDGVELEDVTTEESVAEEVQEEPIGIETTSVVDEAVAQEAIAQEQVVEESVVEETNIEEAVVEVPVVEDSDSVAEVQTSEEFVKDEPSVDEPVVEIAQPQEIKKEQESEKPVFIEDKKSSRFLWVCIVLLVLIILFGAYWLFLRPDNTAEVVSAPKIQEEKVSVPVEAVIEKDTLAEVIPQELVQYVKLSSEELLKERVPSLADTVDYQIVGTQTEYILQNGETIIRASVRFFGTKKYWPYIVKHNMDVLPDPDKIPAGIQIKIPKLVERK